MERGDILSSKSISELSEQCIFTYSLENLQHIKKTQFGYALRGRDGKSGLIEELGGKVYGRNCFKVSSQNITKIETFFKFWKVNFEKEKAYFVDNKQK